MRSAWKRLGVKSLLWQVPARPNFAAGSYLHTKLAWHLGTVCCVPGICIFIEAWSLVAMHPLGINNQVSCSLIHSWSLLRVLGRGVFASNHSNVVQVLEMREHSILCHHMILAGVWLLILCRGEGAPETLMDASGHSSTLLIFG